MCVGVRIRCLDFLVGRSLTIVSQDLTRLVRVRLSGVCSEISRQGLTHLLTDTPDGAFFLDKSTAIEERVVKVTKIKQYEALVGAGFHAYRWCRVI